MEQYVGLDVSQENTHVCVVDGQGKTLWQGKCDSTPGAIAATVRERAPGAARIGLESGSLSTWHWRELTTMGLPAICIDARHAKQALGMQMNKTDRNDALGLAQIMRTGWYRQVIVKSTESHQLRALLKARWQLVSMRVGISNQMRGLLKTSGIILGKTGRSLDKRVMEAATADGGLLGETLLALLKVGQSLKEQLAKLDRKILRHTRDDRMCRHLMTIPGVGPLTALAFVTGVDDAARFGKSKNVGAYFGLTPRRQQSGEVDYNGRISKCGDSLVRSYLFEAAGVLLFRVNKWCTLRAWGLRLAKRSGVNKARVAVARKLAVIMHRMMLTGEEFRWSAAPADQAAA